MTIDCYKNRKEARQIGFFHFLSFDASRVKAQLTT